MLRMAPLWTPALHHGCLTEVPELYRRFDRREDGVIRPCYTPEARPETGLRRGHAHRVEVVPIDYMIDWPERW
ncbi:hypothetical protein [Micromonospora sp. NPDC049679]|uniref:hypothetical protein n=1 Tax=Micromonospora sp. NPDC049679 TaxID=3155920 RepID=UPI0033E6D7A4